MEMADAHAKGGTTASTGTVPLREWTHLAIVVDRQRFTTSYYLNGKLDSVAAIPRTFVGVLDVVGRDLYLGGSHLSFVGSLDEVKLYRRALSPDEIQASYREPTQAQRGAGKAPTAP
jgi:hypothetical protein